MNKFLVTVLFFGLSFQFCQAQSLSAFLKAADDAYERKDYYSAYRYYGVVIEFDSTLLMAWNRYGQSALQYGSYTLADTAFAELIARDVDVSYPLAPFWRGESKLYLGQYDEARELYSQFLQNNSDNNGILTRRAEKAIEKCDWAIGWLSAPPTDTIRHAGDIINSRYSDFAPVAVGDDLYFSSLRFINRRDTMNPPRELIKLLQYNTQDSTLEVLPKDINVEGKHVGHTAFNMDYTRVYYTECDYLNATDIRCTLMVRDRLADGSWINPRPASVNLDGYTTTQPNIAFDSTLMQEVLYFVSDRPGSENSGNFDIWYSTILPNDSLMAPKPFGLNTSLNETTPFFHTATQTLYFSSDGYPGFGGYDVFKAQRTALGWTEPENLKLPVNSSYNDLYYAMFNFGSKAYFSSNRPDSLALFWDENYDACCNDIYFIDYEVKVQLLALTYNLLDSTTLAGASVALYRINPDGTETKVDSLDNLTGNRFGFEVDPNRKYKLRAYKDGYTRDSARVDLSDLRLQNSLTIERKLYLEPPVQPVDVRILTFNQTLENPLPAVQLSVYEVTPTGPRLVTTVTQPDGHIFDLDLLPNKKYRIQATRDGFSEDMLELDLTSPKIIAEGNIERNMILYPMTGPVVLDVTTLEAEGLTALNGVTVSLYEITPEGKEVKLSTLLDPAGNAYTFPVLPGKKYLVKGEKPGFSPAATTLDLTTGDFPPGTRLERQLVLQPQVPRGIPTPVLPGIAFRVLTFDTDNTQPLTGTTVEIYEITPEGYVLVAAKGNKDGHIFDFDLLPGKQYRVKGLKPGYLSDRKTLDFTTLEVEPGVVIEEELILRKRPPVELDVFTYLRNPSNPLSQVTVSLYEITPEGPVLIETITNPNGHDFNFPLIRGKKYRIKGERDGFTMDDDIVDLTDPRFMEMSRIQRDLILFQEFEGDPQLEIRTFEGGDTLIELPGVTLTLTKLRNGQPELPDVQQNEFGNDFLYPLELGVQYIISATKPGFQPFIDTTLFRPADVNPSTQKVSLVLQMTRISFDDFLPLALYYDNDRPDPDTRNRITAKSYPEVFQPYYDQKDRFIEEFTRDMDEEEKFLTSERFEDFFEREVGNGYQDLLDFSEKLFEYLKQGNAIEIEIQGYCSPRGQTSYNDILSERRIDCVINHFEKFRSGVLRPYMQSGSFKIISTPRGERTAAPEVSEDLDDERNSIYSVLASVERRVEIIEVKANIVR
jgi:tetratricopeptide (TPR) repeat protein